MRLNKRRKKLVIFIFVEALVILIVVHLYLSPNSKELTSESPGELTRDFVMNQPDFEDMEEEIRRSRAEKPRETGKLNIYRDDSTIEIKDYKCVHLRTPKGPTPICVYPRQVDNMISAHVMDFQTWEENWLSATADIFRKHDDLIYLDLGCNIGVYTLFVAKMGALVYAVDPNRHSLSLLAKSLRLGNMQENVTLILNAISDKHETVSLEVNHGNVGGSLIKSIDKVYDTSNLNRDYIVKTVTLDDIGAILKDKHVFIKMDIESYEINAIKGVHDFFETVDVRYIQMEWTHVRHNEKGHVIVNSLIKHGLFPYAEYGREQLNPDKYYSWPEDIIWIKR